MRDFDELVGGGDLEATERERLERVHDLLVAAGPPPELPPALEQAPAHRRKSEIAYFPRRRWAAAALVAAALAAAAFGLGYVVADSGGGGGTFDARAVVEMRAAAGAPQDARATLQLGSRDKAGNWPMLVNVTGLREVGTGGYYNIYLTKAGRPVVLCGSFVVHGDRTTVQYSEPYSLAHFDGWVVTLQTPRKHEPGRVVLRTSDV